MNRWKKLAWILAFVGCFVTCEPVHARQRNKKAELTAEAVRSSITRGVQFLKNRQNADTGAWNRHKSEGDVTALCALALLNAGEPENDPSIRKAISHIETVSNLKLSTYFVSLRIMVLANADPRGNLRKIARDVQWLVNRQVSGGANSGGWGYDAPGRGADASNSQFALLALHEGAKLGIEIDEKVWQRAAAYWEAVGTADGGFCYNTGGGASLGSMTCAGISSLIIIDENLANQNALINEDRAICCGGNAVDDRVEQAIDWMAAKFQVKSNPGHRNRITQLYYLYGMERAGRLAGRRFFGAHDWYRTGAERLLEQQIKLSGMWKGQGHGEDNEDVATALALLFLSKGKRPIAIGKAQWGPDNNWDQHPKGIHYLTRRLEKEWEQPLNWQTVRIKNASTDDLLEAPVLFFSGTQALKLDDKEKQDLKQYLENGGFLFAEACQGEGCGNADFHQAFTNLMAEIFPASRLEPLAPDHPIWGAHYPLIPDRERPLLGLQACCRTNVVYCPANLSCYWSLDRPSIEPSPRLKKRIESCVQIGVNVVTYATGRQLQDKGETPKLVEQANDLLAGRVLEMPKLMHGGGSDDAPNAWRNVLRDISDVGLRIEMEKKLVAPNLEQLADYPFVFMHGRSKFEFTEKQRNDLTKYLELGGFLFADSICSTPAFTKSFRREIKLITGTGLAPIPAQHPMWTDQRFGYSIDQVTLRTRDGRAEGGFREQQGPPELEHVEVDGRIAVVFSPHDLSCAMENTAVSQCTGYPRGDASRIATNVVLYSFRSD